MKTKANKRMKIGLLVSELENRFVEAIVSGVEAAAEELDADLIILPGRSIVPDSNKQPSKQYDYQHNAIYSFAAINKLDVVLVSIGTIATNGDEKLVREFLRKFGDIPVITLGGKIAGRPCVCFDNDNGLYEGISKLIKECDCRKIGFVGGPISNMDARERLLVYREALMENGIAFDPHRVVYGDFGPESQSVVRTLLDDNPDLQAVVFANDNMAIGGYEVFAERRLEVGSDIFVLGFDDSPTALILEPNLSTVRADASKMGYEAVMNCQDLINGLKNHLLIDTKLIVRESFGRASVDFSDFVLGFKGISEEKYASTVFPPLADYLFDGLHDRETIEKHSTLLRDCVEYIFGLIYDKPSNVIMYDVLSQKLGAWIRLKDDVPIHRKIKVLEYLNWMVDKSLLDVTSKYRFAEVMKLVYKDAYFLSDRTIYEDKSDAEQINYESTMLTRDILSYENGDERTYSSMLDKLERLYLRDCYLYVYPRMIIHKENEKVKVPPVMNLRVFKNEQEMGTGVGEEFEIPSDQIFDNKYVTSETRKTYVATLLFVAEEQYGFMLLSVSYRHYKYVRTISRQFATALRTIFLLKQNAALTAQMEDNIRQIQENNQALDEISKRDELTGIYNRRGFIQAVENVIHSEAARNKKAIVVYADMNNLKIVNDSFGHEEGDFALRLVAEMLKESFRNSDIIGRFGGDEFAAFAIVDQVNFIEKLHERIQMITEKENAKTDKPYFVSMSVGVCEFVCGADVSLTDVLDTADGDLYIQKKNKRTEIMK